MILISCELGGVYVIVLVSCFKLIGGVRVGYMSDLICKF